MKRRIVVLTEGHTNPIEAKTAACVIRYRGDEVVAALDSTAAGRRTGELLGVGGDKPIVASLGEAPEADTLLIGIAPSGGKIPPRWRPIILEALRRGMDVISGLHEFLCDDAQFAAAARESGAKLVDVRKNDERDVAKFEPFRTGCLRIHTVGQDCSLGKMLTSVELTRALNARGHDAKFIATGQTGIMIEGDGCPVDRVVSDFIAGAVEKQILANQHHDFLIVEGQGSIVHPKYSAVTLGLLHGCRPQGMILCYEVGRTVTHGLPSVPLPPLAKVRELNEMMASVLEPSRVIGVAMNTSRVTAAEAEADRERVRAKLGLPVCDVIRHGPDELVEAVLALRRELLDEGMKE
jgi:uncharacterized NAD-dependent epimerase/dehydratase family protein